MNDWKPLKEIKYLQEGSWYLGYRENKSEYVCGRVIEKYHGKIYLQDCEGILWDCDYFLPMPLISMYKNNAVITNDSCVDNLLMSKHEKNPCKK